MHLQKVVLVPLAIIGMLVTFLPWYTTAGQASTDGRAGAGWITFSIYIIILLVLLTGNFKWKLSAFSLTCISLLSILCSVYGIILTGRQSPGTFANLSQTLTSTGIGLYLLIITGFLVPITGLFLRRNSVKEIMADNPAVDHKLRNDE